MLLPECAPDRGFSKAEFEARLARAQSLMADAGLSGMLFMSEAEIRYFSGFQTLFWQSPTRPWFLFVPLMGKPIAIIPEIGEALMARTWIDDIRTWAAPRPSDDGISLLTELLLPLAKNRATLGILKGHETNLRMPLGDYERLLDALPNLNLADATPIVRALRMVKSAEEIEKIRHICTIASNGFDRADELFSQGQSLIEVFRAFRMELLRQGADDVPYLVGGAGPGGYDDVISPPTSRPLQSGDVLMLDTGSVFDGYFCDFDRNFAIGKVSSEAKRAYETLYQATEIGLETARAGMPCSELFRAMQAFLDQRGGESGEVGRLGHGLGMQLTEWPSHAAFDDTILQENMVITLEPSLGIGDGRVMVHEENIVISEGHPLLLSKRAAPELPVIG